MSQSLNQFNQNAEAGDMTLKPAKNVVSAQVDSSQAGTIAAGQPVKLVDSAGGIPKVVALADPDDVTFGFVVRNPKKSSYSALDKLEIATGYDDVMYVVAEAAIARGALLRNYDATSGKVVTATGGSGKHIVGWAFDKAAADGDLIRMSLACPSYFKA